VYNTHVHLLHLDRSFDLVTRIGYIIYLSSGYARRFEAYLLWTNGVRAVGYGEMLIERNPDYVCRLMTFIHGGQSAALFKSTAFDSGLSFPFMRA